MCLGCKLWSQIKWWSFKYKAPEFVRMWRHEDSNVNGANMGPTWVLSAPDEPHVGPMNFVIRAGNYTSLSVFWWFGVCALNICGICWTHQWIPTTSHMVLYILYFPVFLLGKTKSNDRDALLAHTIKRILYLFLYYNSPSKNHNYTDLSTLIYLPLPKLLVTLSQLVHWTMMHLVRANKFS